MILQDGPLAGREVNTPIAPTLVLPAVDGDGAHFADHYYDRDGRWLKSQTYVGYESDESIAEREAFWEQSYWDGIEADSDRSFV